MHIFVNCTITTLVLIILVRLHSKQTANTVLITETCKFIHTRDVQKEDPLPTSMFFHFLLPYPRSEATPPKPDRGLGENTRLKTTDSPWNLSRSRIWCSLNEQNPCRRWVSIENESFTCELGLISELINLLYGTRGARGVSVYCIQCIAGVTKETRCNEVWPTGRPAAIDLRRVSKNVPPLACCDFNGLWYFWQKCYR